MQLNLQSPISQDSATMGIKMGSVSLSSSTSKDGHPHILPHLGIEDHSQVFLQGPDTALGLREPGNETTANTTGGLEEEFKDEQKTDSKLLSLSDVT